MEPTSTAKVAEEAAKELGLTQLVPAIYQDVLQPAAKEVGQRFVIVAKAVGIALSPLEGAVWGYQQIKDFLAAKVAAKLASKPAEEINAPDKVIAGPVVMGMAFASEAPHLREMYANLLATAMHKPSAGKAHPSFVQAIQQLSPDEARILEVIAKSHDAEAIIMKEGAIEDTTRMPQPPRIREQWAAFCGECGVKNEGLSHAYYNNLIRLGILMERTLFGTPDPFGGFTSEASENYLALTSYGDLFLDVCVRSD